jgi:hypothetical protein
MTHQFISLREWQKLKEKEPLKVEVQDIASYHNLRHLGMTLANYLSDRSWQAIMKRLERGERQARKVLQPA